VWTILAENSPLHIPICHTCANHDDRIVWAEEPGVSFATIPLLVFNILFNEYTARSDFSQLSTIDRSRYICFHGSSLLKFGASIKHEVQIVITNLEISFGCRHKISKQSDELAEAEGTTGNLDDATSAYKSPWMHPTNLESSSAQPLNV